MDDRSIRLECLKYAIGAAPNIGYQTADFVLKTAEQYYNWVKGIKQPKPDTKQFLAETTSQSPVAKSQQVTGTSGVAF